MLCLADRLFSGYRLWEQARSTGADLLWRVGRTFVLALHKRLPDGSYLSRLYATTYDQRHDRNGIPVRVIEYRLEGVADAGPSYRLITTIVDHTQAPADELAAVYHERWEIETALDELNTHLRGPRIVLRSKMPDLVRQEFYGLIMAHFAIRSLMHDAALRAHVDPNRQSFLHTVRVVRRKLPRCNAIPPQDRKAYRHAVLEKILEERVAPRRPRQNARGGKRKMSGHRQIRSRTPKAACQSRIPLIK